MIIRFIILIGLLLLVDLYSFQSFKTAFNSSKVNIAFWVISLIAFLAIGSSLLTDYKDWPKPLRTYLFATIFVIYICKVFLIIFLLFDDIGRFGKWIYSFFHASPEPNDTSRYISRSQFLNRLGLIITAIPFLALVNGMLNGAFNFTVRKVKVPLRNLPVGFKGLKIVHISDLHLGGFINTSPIEEVVKLIEKQKADIVFFTGDLVNNVAEETHDFIEILKKIEVPMGVYSILGNHDYGDYQQWSSKKEKIENLESLKNIQRDLGWRLLLNENVELERNGDKISLIGVENWGAYAHFTKYGDIDKALEGLPNHPVSILLSHDPSHWTEMISKKYKNIDLTLSGHTHGFQFGVEVAGFRWSPIKYMYKHWADLYNSDHQYLYVNRGIGFLGYPGRVGILPEITVLELT